MAGPKKPPLGDLDEERDLCRGPNQDPTASRQRLSRTGDNPTVAHPGPKTPKPSGVVDDKVRAHSLARKDGRTAKQ